MIFTQNSVDISNSFATISTKTRTFVSGGWIQCRNYHNQNTSQQEFCRVFHQMTTVEQTIVKLAPINDIWCKRVSERERIAPLERDLNSKRSLSICHSSNATTFMLFSDSVHNVISWSIFILHVSMNSSIFNWYWIGLSWNSDWTRLISVMSKKIIHFHIAIESTLHQSIRNMIFCNTQQCTLEKFT